MNKSMNLVETNIFNSVIIHSVANFNREVLGELSLRMINTYSNCKCYVYCSSIDKMYLHTNGAEFLIPLYNVGGADPERDPSYIKLNKSSVQVTHQERLYRTDHETH